VVKNSIEGTALLREAAARHQVCFITLIAETGLWADPQVHARLVEETGSAAWFPNMRRGRIHHGEKRGQTRDGIRFDDNSYANTAIKQAIGYRGIKGFATCHIWPNTCYDERYHTAIANLVLLPRAIAGLSDHDEMVQAALQYRAYELYGWHPVEVPTPQKPAIYPTSWLEPVSSSVKRASSGYQPRRQANSNDDSGSSLEDELREPARRRRPEIRPTVAQPMSPEERAFVSGRIREWARKPDKNVHTIVSIVIHSRYGIDRDALAREAARLTGTVNPKGAIASLMTSAGNAYGRIFVRDDAGMIKIHPEVADEVAKFEWRRLE
jgi:hypothetical protein